MNYKLALKVVKSESHEITAHRIVELYNVIKKLSSINSSFEIIEFPSLHDVMDIIRPKGSGEEIPPIIVSVYNTIKKLSKLSMMNTASNTQRKKNDTRPPA